MVDILKIKRTDEEFYRSWGNNVSMIIASDSDSYTEELIEKYLIKDKDGEKIKMENGGVLTREFIQIEKLGTSNDVKLGIISLDNVGD